ncbi:Rid family hydrolase [Streptomyces sp. NPDC051217]|uniref:Rid family hydrolase n=1 Tax=Streptomyces sp. NPDC051217 TaxID=3365644 RepID=UPI00379FC560
MEDARQVVSSGSPLEPEIGFSRAVRVGSYVVVAGTAPIGDDGSTVGPGDVYAQTVRCLDIAERALREAGAGTADVVRTRLAHRSRRHLCPSGHRLRALPFRPGLGLHCETESGHVCAPEWKGPDPPPRRYAMTRPTAPRPTRQDSTRRATRTPHPADPLPALPPRPGRLTSDRSKRGKAPIVIHARGWTAARRVTRGTDRRAR